MFMLEDVLLKEVKQLKLNQEENEKMLLKIKELLEMDIEADKWERLITSIFYEKEIIQAWSSTNKQSNS